MTELVMSGSERLDLAGWVGGGATITTHEWLDDYMQTRTPVKIDPTARSTIAPVAEERRDDQRSFDELKIG